MKEQICLSDFSLRGRVFFVGIGGSGMYGVALLAQRLGFTVIGCDAKESANTRRLREKGVRLFPHGAPLPEGVSLVVFSLAVAKTHPLITEASARGIPTLDRAAFFGLLMSAFPVRLGVAGTHGKSTTVGMCDSILRAAGWNATVVSGADLDGEGSFRGGGKEVLLFEACEYRDAFLSFSPTHALVLSTERDHTDYFATEEAVLASFRAFLTGRTVQKAVAPQGFLPNAFTFGEGGEISAAHPSLYSEGSSFDLVRGGEVLGPVTLSVAGDYQIHNALGAAALMLSAGVPPRAVTEGLCAFRGIPRRMEMRCRVLGVPLYIDFAHHPTELRAVLRAAIAFGRPVACVFEIHTFSRAHAFGEEYAEALSRVDRAALLPVYAAREREEGTARVESIASKARATFLPDYASAARFLTEAARDGFFLLLAGAGGVEEVLTYL